MVKYDKILGMGEGNPVELVKKQAALIEQQAETIKRLEA
jgi:hypothetical protein